LTEAQRLIPACDPPLADTLRHLMPCAHTTLLLQAALLQNDAVGKAWSQWRQAITDPKAFLASDRVGIKRHLPLLYRNLVSHGVDLGRNLEPYFRAARAREEMRSARYRRYLGEALAALQQGGINFVVGKGVTVGETIHTDPVVRHSHDVDLLVCTESMSAAAAALQARGFARSANTGAGGEQRFDHISGLPIELHDRLYRTPFYDGDLPGVWSRARAGEILGVPVRLIGDADLLVHAPVHASLVLQRRGLSWIVDVVSLLRKRAAEGVAIDWSTVLQIARDARTSLPLYVTYQYLAETFDAPIPRHATEELRRAAARIGTAQRLAALDGLRSEPRTSGIRMLMGASGWRSRVVMARALLLPPPSYLKTQRPEMNRPALTLLYVTRPLRFVARQLRRALYRLRRWLGARMNGPQPVLVDGSADAAIPQAEKAAATTGRSST
jgi:Uncharacterised nucleotidyltransferase